MQRGKNMAIANALQLEAPPDATPVHAKFEVAEPIHCRIAHCHCAFAADTLFYAVTLTFHI